MIDWTSKPCVVGSTTAWRTIVKSRLPAFLLGAFLCIFGANWEKIGKNIKNNGSCGNNKLFWKLKGRYS